MSIATESIATEPAILRRPSSTEKLQKQYVIALTLLPDAQLTFKDWLKQHNLALTSKLEYGVKKNVHYR